MKKIKWESAQNQVPWIREGYRAAGIILLTAAVLFLCSIMGSIRNADTRMFSMEASAAESYKKQVEEARQESEKASVQASVEESIREETAVHQTPLTYMEERLLNLLSEYLGNGDLEGAARVMNLNKESLETLFFDKLADGFFLYDGSRMTDETHGSGLTFSRASTVFYGEFNDGQPDGECVALQAVNLPEGVRYDYSKGTWRDGQMEGPGETGYHYYEGVAGDTAKQVKKEGIFSKNRMEGDITYTSVNSDGEATVWTMNVKNGVIQPDERWSFNRDENENGVYRLLSDTDKSHAYVVDGDTMKEASWKNIFSNGARGN